MENTTLETPKKESKGKKVLVIFVISLLLIANGVLIWMLMDKNQIIVQTKEVLRVETSLKDSLTIVKDQLLKDFEESKSQNASLNEQLSEKDKEIRDLHEKIRKQIESGDAAQLAMARNELKKLKGLLSNYTAQKDSLLQVTVKLSQEKQTLTVDLDQEKIKSTSLSTENVKLSEKVTVGSVLRTDNVRVMAYKLKSNSKEVETNKAKSTKVVKTCFTLVENTVAEKGTKDFYVRIIGPSGSAFTNTSETFKYNGQETLYTTKESINYENKKSDECISWTNPNAFVKGKYTAEVYNSGTLVGKASMELK